MCTVRAAFVGSEVSLCCDCEAIPEAFQTDIVVVVVPVVECVAPRARY